MDHERDLTVSRIAELACAMEVLCPKPGNVGPGRPFKYMNEMSFIASAIGLAEAFADASAPVGRLVERAAGAAKKLTGRNTNLGIILLLAPLARAAYNRDREGGATDIDLRESVSRVLSALDGDDSAAIYAAIRSAAPEGLGASDRYDVNGESSHIMEAMRFASAWDSIAGEYASGYRITFGLTAPRLDELWRGGHTLRTSIAQTFLSLLGEVPDTLIARKRGRGASEEASLMAGRALGLGGYLSEEGRAAVSELRSLLEDPDNLMNPGTTADLMAAGIFVFLLNELERTPLSELLGRWDMRRDTDDRAPVIG
jgi:triphosphoribosyl-dephospho-CoA synthase